MIATFRRTFWATCLLTSVGCSDWVAPDDAATGGNNVACGDGSAGAGGSGTLPTSYPRGLHVVGNRIQDAEGNDIVLRGVNRSGTEYRCVQSAGIFDGSDSDASVRAMTTWNINAVRVPLNESCWLGINGVAEQFASDAYKAAIVAYVELLHKYAIVPILDLHWAAPEQLAIELVPMPNAAHSRDFWRDVATTFLDDDGVVLEPYNEPYPDRNRDTDEAWQCWRDGCVIAEPRVGSYEAIGMQAMVDAIRETGSRHVVLLGGVQYSNGLSQWLSRMPEDPLGNLGAAWHVYNINQCRDEACWNDAPAAVAAQVPLVATEIGQDDCRGTFITPLMQWLDSKGAGYLAWSWNALGTCQPLVRMTGAGQPWGLVTDYACGTPSGGYAEAFRAHLLQSR